jgi:hypothetical protein
LAQYVAVRRKRPILQNIDGSEQNNGKCIKTGAYDHPPPATKRCLRLNNDTDIHNSCLVPALSSLLHPQAGDIFAFNLKWIPVIAEGCRPAKARLLQKLLNGKFTIFYHAFIDQRWIS